MSDTEELERLHALKEKGILSDEEFNTKKAQILNAGATEKKKKPRSVLRIIFASVGVIVGGLGLLSAIGSLSAGGQGVPDCGSDEAISALSDAFDQAQFAKAYNLSAVEVTGAKEQAYDKETGVRSCSARISMNNASTANVKYRLEPRDGGKFMLTFQVVDNSGAATVPTTR